MTKKQTEKTQSHTPGPWCIDDYKTAGGAPVICSNDCWRKTKRRVAKALYEFGSEDPEVAHNARLIAAAPELLEALKDLVEAHRKSMGFTALRLRVDLAKSAISKATNQTGEVING